MSAEFSKEAVAKEILATNGILINLGSLIKHGVSGAYVWNGKLIRENSEVVVKYGHDIGIKEKAGVRKLSEYLLLAPSIAFGPNHAIYRKIEGPTLHEVVQKSSPESQNLLERYIKIHRKLWGKTQVDNVILEGYPKKLESTIELANKICIMDVTGVTLPLEEYLDHEWVVNGVLIGKPLEKLQLMKSYILSKGLGVMAHGDESAGNALIERNSRKIYMIDNCNAGVRSVHESIAKIILWFDVIMTKSEHFALERNGRKVILETRQASSRAVYLADKCNRKSFREYLNNPEEERKISAYMMMYLIRETQWLKARGREDITPYILAKLLTISANLIK